MRWTYLCLLVPVISHAHVLPASYVLGQWAETLKKTKTLHVKLETTFGDDAKVEDEIWIDKPSNFRRTIKNASSRVDLIVTASHAYKISSGRVETVPPVDALGPIGLLYAADGLKGLTLYLRQNGIDLDQVRWDRNGNTLLWEAGLPKGPFVSFMKEEWVPTSLTMGNKTVVFTTPLPSRYAGVFPEVVEVFSGKTRIEQNRTISAKSNMPLPEALFDPKLLRSPPQKK